MADVEEERLPFPRGSIASFNDLLRSISTLLTKDNFKAMKRFLYDIISTKIGDRYENSLNLFEALSQVRCISGDDLDLLEDMLGVTGREEIVRLVLEFKKRRNNKLGYLSFECLANISKPVEGRSVVSFILHDGLETFDRNKVFRFKGALCKALKLVRSEVSWIGKARDLENKVLYQLPFETLPLLRHCTGWKKDWLFDLGVKGVQIDDEPSIVVQDVKVQQLRLQEDPVLVSPVLRTSEAARTGDVSELRRVLDSSTCEKRSYLLSARIDGATPLITAAKNGNTAIVQCLVDEYGVNVEQEGTVKVEEDLIECCTALWMASLGGHIGVVRFLLERNAEVNHTTLTYSTALRAAAFNGHAEVVRLLLANEACVNQRNQDGNTCVMVACWNGHLGTFSLLRNAGADMDVKDNQGFGLLHCATAANNLSLLHELLVSGKDVNSKTTDGITPLMLACEKNHPDVTLLLLQHNSHVDARSDKGLTAVHFCALSNSLTSLQHLMDYRADLGIPTERGSTALMLACAKGYTSIVTALLRNMARQRLKSELSAAFTCRSDRQPTTCSVVNTANENGETCLMMACENGSVDIVRILLDEGADPNLVDKKGVTPLILACRRGHERVVPLLLKKGARVETQDEEGNCALHVCVKYYRAFGGQRKCLECLLATGPNLDIKNKEGLSPMMMAVQTKVWFGHAIEAFYERGGDLATNLKADNGDTAFHKCARSGDLLSMTFLISVDPQGPFGLNHDKDTPLRAAALEGADAMTQTLINTVPAYSHEERIDALELLGVGLLAKDIAREWDVDMVVGFWQEAMAIRKARGIPFPEPRPSLFPLEYFLEARSSVELEEFRSNPSVLTAQALQICDRLLPKYHSRLPALLGTVGERFAQIGEFCRSLNIWQYVLDIQLQNLQKSTDGVEDVMNTFRCFADAFGFVLSRSVDVLSFDVVHTVVKRALDSLRNHPAIFDLRETIMPYLLHYFVSLLSVAINDQDFAVAMDTIRSFVRLGLRNKHGSTLLHLAVSSKTGEISSLKEHLHFPNLKLCERLVECGADVDATDSDRNTPLHTLLTRGHAERDILEFLLKVGCHVDARNKAGKSAEDLARCNKVKQAIRASGIVPRLHCLAARTVLAEEIEYEGIVPRRLESFIQMH